MKKIMTLFALTAVLLLGAMDYAEAQQALRGGQYSESLGRVRSDTLRWLASGDLPGASGLTVDTLIGSTLNDTSVAIDIAGTQSVSVFFHSRSRNDDSDFTLSALLGPTNHPTGAWDQILATWSVANTAGSAVGQSEDTGRDSVTWVIKHA